MYQQVVNFWFEDIDPKMWWVADTRFDQVISSRFLGLLQQAAVGELYRWRSDAMGRLAEIIVLDQFSRNAYRHTPQAFAQDTIALVLAQEAVLSGALETLSPEQRTFLLMPFMHSESSQIHCWAEDLFKQHTSSNNYQFELRHKEIINRFGRYPHRNEILGRPSTPAEIEYLKQPGSGF